jgi:HAD superfamily hydrolase (TIGR01509 family)
MTASGGGTELGAVLFDMDGTLIDSEKLWDVALDDLAHWLGGELSAVARTRMIGASLTRSVTMLHEDLGVQADLDASRSHLIREIAALYRTDVVWQPGAQELLVAVHAAGVPAALVTSTSRRLTELALDSLGRENFAVTVCGDEVVHPKPAAEPYLTAAGLLGVAPDRCVAIEDSPTGIASAEAAGCAVLAVPNDVALSSAPTRVVVASLVGMDLAGLQRVLAAHLDGRRDPV